MSDSSLLDVTGRRRSPAATPGFLCGRMPHNKGLQYPPDPPRPEEIILVMRRAGHDRHGLRIRGLIAVLWRAGLRISEALALTETDIDNVARAEETAQVRAVYRGSYRRLDRGVQAASHVLNLVRRTSHRTVTSRGGENTWPRRTTSARTPRRTGVTVSSRPLESAAAPAGERCRRRLQSGSPARA